MNLTPKLIIYFLIIAFLSMFLEDARFLFLIQSPVKVTVMDFLYLLVFLYFLRANFETTFFQELLSSKIYLIYLVFILIALVYGISQWDFIIALGGLKIFAPMFAISLPVFIVGKTRLNDTEYIARLFRATVVVSAIGSLVLFIIEIFYGGRFFFTRTLSYDLGLDRMEDFRGIRYLGSQETFNILLLALLLIYRSVAIRKIKGLEIFPALGLIIVSLITKNRTAILSLTGIFLIQTLLTQRRLLLFLISVSIILSFAVIEFINPKITKAIMEPYTKALNVGSDVTGSWRLYSNLAYLREGLNTPVLGKGLTSHYAGGVYVKELKEKITFPPHNMFVIQFFQSGIVATLLLLIFTVILTAEIYKLNKYLQNNQALLQSNYLLLTIVSSQIVYGQFYGYIWFFGLYCGFSMLMIQSVYRNALPGPSLDGPIEISRL